ncbi:Transcriptional regulator of nonfermentable carbon utilization, partial [Elasticomyces elasticus]
MDLSSQDVGAGAGIDTALQGQSMSPVDSGNELEGEGDSTIIDPMSGQNKNGVSKPASNAKDPNRPKRKKARRACYACQRAHLTCGDERPCQRCVKRGLAEQCQDGVRKKAKYLHDAPSEALLPGAATQYNQHDQLKRSSTTSTLLDTNGRLQSFSAGQPLSQPYTPLFNNNVGQMPPPTMHERTTSFGQQSMAASTFGLSQPLQSPTSMRQAHGSVSLPTSGWGDALFGAEDPSLFNFDLASMNFGNHYGALEFGMLGNMAKGAGDAHDNDVQTQRGSINFGVPYGSISEQPPLSYDGMMDWSNGANLNYQLSTRKEPNAFAIESTAHLTSPENHQTPDTMQNDSPLMNLQLSLQNTRQNLNNMQLPQTTFLTQPTSLPQHQDSYVRNSTSSIAHTIPPQPQFPPQVASTSTPQLKAKSQLPNPPNSKRPRDPSSIYTSITQPYPYTSGFHSLIDYLKRRFNSRPDLTLRIAKSLASIRPSFIATTKTLNRDDLVFMEKCFQRTLFEYEGFIEGVGTPTIVARRTGEIVGVGKEFQILTGWRKAVLLGRESNLNVNRGRARGEKMPANVGGRSGVATGTGTNTPALRRVDDETADREPRQQPVFLAELLDDDSVVQFYEDFARLAFGDSRGSVMGKGRLLKYRTKEDEIKAELKREVEKQQQAQNDESISPIQQKSSPNLTQGLQRTDSFAAARPGDAKKGISGQKGMQKLGMTDGKVDCAYCWMVKRDVFDIPMLIVMN